MPPEPIYPPPQNEPGALTQPRQLQRWLDTNIQGGALSRSREFITVPTFSEPVVHIGESDIIVAFNFESPNNFSFVCSAEVITQNGFSTQIPGLNVQNPNYLLVMMWK